MNFDASIGINKMETKSEDNSEKLTVQACSLNSSPAAPCRYTIGRNTTIVVNVEAVIAPATSEVPLTAASAGGRLFSSMFRKMFSITTMALSTSIPAPSASPPNVMMLMESPLKYIKLNVAMIEIGMERLTIKVMFIRRKNK